MHCSAAPALDANDPCHGAFPWVGLGLVAVYYEVHLEAQELHL